MNKIEQKACELCQKRNGAKCTTPVPDPDFWICKAWLEKAKHSQPLDEGLPKCFDSLLLTDERLLEINNQAPSTAKYGEVFKAIRDEQYTKCQQHYEAKIKKLELERDTAIKEIGAWARKAGLTEARIKELEDKTTRDKACYTAGLLDGQYTNHKKHIKEFNQVQAQATSEAFEKVGEIMMSHVRLEPGLPPRWVADMINQLKSGHLPKE